MLCHSERSEESENINWRFFSLRSTTRQILRDAQDDTMLCADLKRFENTCHSLHECLNQLSINLPQ